MAQSVSTVVLEPAAQEFAKMTANPPFLFQLGPEKGRAKLDELQSGTIARPEVDIEDIMVPGGPSGQVPIRIVRPKGSRGAQGGGGLRERVRSAAQGMIQQRGTQTMLPAVLYRAVGAPLAPSATGRAAVRCGAVARRATAASRRGTAKLVARRRGASHGAGDLVVAIEEYLRVHNKRTETLRSRLRQTIS